MLGNRPSENDKMTYHTFWAYRGEDAVEGCTFSIWCCSGVLDEKGDSYMMSRRVHGRWLEAMGLSFC